MLILTRANTFILVDSGITAGVRQVGLHFILSGESWAWIRQCCVRPCSSSNPLTFDYQELLLYEKPFNSSFSSRRMMTFTSSVQYDEDIKISQYFFWHHMYLSKMAIQSLMRMSTRMKETILILDDNKLKLVVWPPDTTINDQLVAPTSEL